MLQPYYSPINLRGPRIIAVAGNRGHLWGEQHRIKTRTKRNHSRVNSGRLTIGGNYSRSPKVSSEASDRYHAMRPPTPAEPQPPAGFEELWKTITVGQLAMLPADHQINVWLRETEERRLAIRRNHSAKCQRLMRKCGVNVAEANASKLADEVWKIGKRIFATQAHTIDGIKIKFRTAERMDPDKEIIEDAWTSLEKDICALSVV